MERMNICLGDKTKGVVKRVFSKIVIWVEGNKVSFIKIVRESSRRIFQRSLGGSLLHHRPRVVGPQEHSGFRRGVRVPGTPPLTAQGFLEADP